MTKRRSRLRKLQWANAQSKIQKSKPRLDYSSPIGVSFCLWFCYIDCVMGFTRSQQGSKIKMMYYCQSGENTEEVEAESFHDAALIFANNNNGLGQLVLVTDDANKDCFFSTSGLIDSEISLFKE